MFMKYSRVDYCYVDRILDSFQTDSGCMYPSVQAWLKCFEQTLITYSRVSFYHSPQDFPIFLSFLPKTVQDLHFILTVVISIKPVQLLCFINVCVNVKNDPNERLLFSKFIYHLKEILC